jgi:flagellar hook-associated protein 2
MASVSSSTSSASSLKGYGGLVSGLDRDSLIENMTAATRAKIAKQKQSRQKLLWKQEAYQSVSSKLVEFANKYTSYSNSSTNLSSSSFWAKSNITTSGTNSKYVSVTGSSTISDSISVVGVKQLAQDASKISKQAVSNSELSTGNINLGTENVSNLEGEYLTFKYGSKTYSVSMKSGTASDGFTYDYSDAEKAAESMNRSLKEVSIGNGKTLADVIEVSTYSTGSGSKLDIKSNDKAGNTILLTGGSDSAVKALGFDDISNMSEADKTISDSGLSDVVKAKEQNLSESKTFAQRVGGKSISFTYNGVTKSIKFGSEAEIQDKINGKTDKEAMDAIAAELEKELEKQFGAGRIDVGVEGDDSKGYNFVFDTKIAGTTQDDKSSVLSITSADKGILGNQGALAVSSGASNRLNLQTSVVDSGLSSMSGIKDQPGYTADKELKLTINDVEITGLTYKSSMNEIIDKINSSDAGVKVSYIKNSDKFSIQSTVAGAPGKVKLGGDAELIFGSNSTDFDAKEGKDAIVAVKYGNGQSEELVRGSNSLDLDGLNITVSGTFGYKDGEIDETAEAVTLSAKANTDKIVSAVSDMVKDFNEIIALVNSQVSTKPNRDYAPLTDEQKENMSEDQIKKWEEKAKTGMLFNDSDLRSLADSMRFIFDAGSDDKALLSSFGISTSSNYGDKGKLVLDESKLRAAIEKNPEELQKLFTKKADSTTGETDGVMAKLANITNKYAATTGATKGILIEKAGSTYAPTSVLSNYLQKSIDSVDAYIKQLQTRLSDENDRYVKQFTNLETVISQMNSQSSWLSSSFGS